MRLQPEELSTEMQLEEFDQWLTAKLERVKDSDKFSSEIDALCNCIEQLSFRLNNFADYDDCKVDNLCFAVIEACGELIGGEHFSTDELKVAAFIDSYFNLLFLTSGATDNNLKNHFLIKLKNDDINPTMPIRGTSRTKIKFKLSKLPSTTKSDYIAKLLAGCLVGSHTAYSTKVTTEPVFDLQFYFKIFLKEYTSLILEDDEDIFQFWAICNSYVRLNETKIEIDSGSMKSAGRYLLNSCTIFKVRGSVSASGGHVTEDILRKKLQLIGLKPDYHYNLNDVVIGDEEVQEDGKRKKKTRAYDFVLPYRVEDWEPKPKLFIQAQFYAGDSGSVSHKVVDQTQSSRAFTIQRYENARFVEYLDGAGYYASLRGDLEHMLSFSDTASFFQVKSIFVRLRRELQTIEFLTPIDVEHAVLTSRSSSLNDIKSSLLEQKYPPFEVERVLKFCIEAAYVEQIDSKIILSEERVSIALKLLILDVAVNNGYVITDKQRNSLKYLLVPGYGPNYGILESELSELFYDICKQHIPSAPTFSKDIEWLIDEGVMRRR